MNEQYDEDDTDDMTIDEKILEHQDEACARRAEELFVDASNMTDNFEAICTLKKAWAYARHAENAGLMRTIDNTMSERGIAKKQIAQYKNKIYEETTRGYMENVGEKWILDIGNKYFSDENPKANVA